MQSQCSGAHVFQEGVSVAAWGCWVCMKAASALLCGFGMVPKVLWVLLQYLNWTSGRIKFKVSLGGHRATNGGKVLAVYSSISYLFIPGPLSGCSSKIFLN